MLIYVGGILMKNKKINKCFNVILCIVLTAFVICILCISLWKNGVRSISDLFIQNGPLENTYYISQILCSIVIAVGGIVGVWQYTLAKRIEKNQHHNNRIQKAIDMAEFYKNNVLCNMTFIYNVYAEMDILKILNGISIEKMNNFDTNELQEVLNPNQLNDIKNKLESRDFIKIIPELADIYAKKGDYKEEVYIKEGNQIVKTIKVNSAKVIEEFMNNTVNDTLNNLEYFAMHFVYETADEEVIYQSIHQTYLDVVKWLYYNIAINNETGEKKYFTNVIELFNKWKKIANEQKRQESQASRQSIIKGNGAKNI